MWRFVQRSPSAPSRRSNSTIANSLHLGTGFVQKKCDRAEVGWACATRTNSVPQTQTVLPGTDVENACHVAHAACGGLVGSASIETWAGTRKALPLAETTGRLFLPGAIGRTEYCPQMTGLLRRDYKVGGRFDVHGDWKSSPATAGSGPQDDDEPEPASCESITVSLEASSDFGKQ
jgi:hypothetical protein